MKQHLLRGQRPRGIITLLALAVIAFVFVLAFSAADGAGHMAGLSINETLQEKARLGAEAGIHDAMSQLRTNAGWNGFNGRKTLPLSSDVGYTVVVTNNVAGSAAMRALDGTSVPAGMVYLVSRGDAGTRSREVAVMLTPASGVSPFSYAVFGSTSQVDLTLANGAAVDSFDSSAGKYGGQNVGADAVVGGNGNIVVTGGAKVNGTASAGPSSTVQVSQGGKVTGTASSAPAAVDFPVVDPTVRSPNMNLTGITVNGKDAGNSYNLTTGDLTAGNAATVTMANGTYYLHNLTIDGAATLQINGPVVIYLSGVLTVNNGAKLNNTTKLPANLQIYSSYESPNASIDGVVLNGGSDTYAAIYAPKSSFLLHNGGHLYGSVVASALTLEGGSRVHYDTALKDVTPAYVASGSGSGSGFVVSGWDRR